MSIGGEDILLRIKAEVADAQAKIAGVTKQLDALGDAAGRSGDNFKQLTFSDLSGDFERLGTQLKNGQINLETFNTRFGQLKQSAVELAPSIDEVGEASTRAQTKIETMATRMIIRMGVIGVAMQALNATAKAIEDNFGKMGDALAAAGFDKIGGDVKVFGDQLAGTMNPLEAVKNISKELAITNQQLAESMVGVSDADNRAAKSAEDHLKQTKGNELAVIAMIRALNEQQEKLDKESESLARAGEALQKHGQLDSALADRVRENIKKQLDSYEKLGEDVPPHLQKIADALGVISTAHEKEAEAAKKAAEKEAEAADQLAAKMREHAKQIEESVRGTTKDLEDTTAALVRYANEVAGSSDASREQIEKVSKEIQGQLDHYAALGKEAPDDLKAVAAAWHVTTSDIEKDAKKAADAMLAVEDAFAQLVKKLSPSGKSNVDDQKKQLDDLIKQRDALNAKPILTDDDRKTAEELDQQIHDLQNNIADLTSHYNNWSDSSNKVASSTKEVNSAISSLLDSIGQKLPNLTQEQRDVIQQTLNDLKNLGDTGAATGEDVANAAQRISDQMRQAGQDTTKLDDAIASAQGTTLDFNKAFDALRLQGDPTEKAREGIGQTGDATKDAAGEAVKFGKVSKEAAEATAKAMKELNGYIKEQTTNLLPTAIDLWKQLGSA